jgi:hypothetical protein
MCIFISRVIKKGEMKFAEGNERPSKQDAWSEAKFAITISQPFKFGHTLA